MMYRWVVNIKDAEVSVLRDNFKHGKESYGWGSLCEKLIIWETEQEDLEDRDIIDRTLAIKMASVIADALNAASL